MTKRKIKIAKAWWEKSSHVLCPYCDFNINLGFVDFVPRDHEEECMSCGDLFRVVPPDKE